MRWEVPPCENKSSGVFYDTKIHDYVEFNGTPASNERVAEAWEIPVEEVEQDRAKNCGLKSSGTIQTSE